LGFRYLYRTDTRQEESNQTHGFLVVPLTQVTPRSSRSILKQGGIRMSTPKTPPRKVIYRSSVTGQIVNQRYAEQHPRTTERQHVDIRNPKK
jgi:hypothetical protein